MGNCTLEVGQFPAGRIDFVGRQGMGVLPAGNEPIPIGGEVKVSGEGPADGLYLGHFRLAHFVQAGGSDRIMSAIGSVKKGPARVHHNFGG